MGLDEILNVLVPMGIFASIGLFIYQKAQEPIDKMIDKIKDWIHQERPESFYSEEDYILGYRKSDY